ncbi:E3 ubiquitin-protein ligase RNF169 [Xyrichtys novacula]|uniref:RING-type E3 ubiquitin transferase n=1 Tax=Xyrichtys novacula TaxID=13765 RepID=A0AAV1FZE2_XYRNO|nr:E3 ubiquitin-protein ligase RNF169 [Xyrichtys novacula]
MATAGSAERPGAPVRAATGRCWSGSGLGAGCGTRSSPPDDEGNKCSACVEGQPGGSPPCGHPACPLCLAHRHSGSRERLRRRSDPERSSSRPGRRDLDNRREFFASPSIIPKGADFLSALSGKHKLLMCEDREEVKRRNTLICKDESVRHQSEPGVLSDSENEEPISRRIRNISAFIRKTKNSAALTSGSQRSQSCTDSVEDRGGKLKVVLQPAMVDRVGISHSFTAGILLSSENSRSVSAPITAPDRKLTWRAVITSSSTPVVLPPPRLEHSISPESNDSISEELNHFKPIVCSPCTPPKRLPDGRLMEPTIVKSTPRNLTRGLQKATSYEASPAVLQKWRQIELDRQSLKDNSKATLTSPINEIFSKTIGGEDEREGVAKTCKSPARRDGDATMSINKRKLLFDPPVGDTDALQKQSVKIRVPAIRYNSEATFRGSADFETTGGAPESFGGGAIFSHRQSFSPYTKNSGFQSCKLVPKDSQSPRRESDSSLHNQSTSRRGKKKEQKTKHLDSERDSDLKRTRVVGQEEERYVCQIQQERQDRALALKLQRQFDLENQTGSCRRSPDSYFLRSWKSNQNRRRRGLRRSRRINKKH